MDAKFAVSDDVMGRSLEHLNARGTVKEVSPPSSRHRGYRYMVEWRSGVSTSELEKDLWRMQRSDRLDQENRNPQDSCSPRVDVMESTTMDEAPPALSTEISTSFEVSKQSDVEVQKGATLSTKPIRTNKRKRSQVLREIDGPSENSELLERDLLNPHGQQWKEVGGIPENINRSAYAGGGMRLNWPSNILNISIGAVKEPYHYFMLLFPFKYLPTITSCTTAQMRSLGHHDYKATDFLNMMGVLLYMALYPIRGSRDDYWITEKKPWELHEPMNIGQRFGIPRDKFRLLLTNFRLAEFTPAKLTAVRSIFCMSFTLNEN